MQPPNPYAGNPYATNPYGVNPYAVNVYAPNPYGQRGLPRPVAVAPVEGTPFGLALVELRPTMSGQAVASLVVGLASIFVSLAAWAVAARFDAAGAGAFALLAILAGVAAVALAGLNERRLRASRPWGPTGGRGVALAGAVLGLVGLAVTLLVMLGALIAG